MLQYRMKVFAQTYGLFLYDFVGSHEESWQHFSGIRGRPIRGYYGLGNWQGDQLNYRLSLINHMINKIEGIV